MIKRQRFLPEVRELKERAFQGFCVDFELADMLFKMQNVDEIFVFVRTFAFYNQLIAFANSSIIIKFSVIDTI